MIDKEKLRKILDEVAGYYEYDDVTSNQVVDEIKRLLNMEDLV